MVNRVIKLLVVILLLTSTYACNESSKESNDDISTEIIEQKENISESSSNNETEQNDDEEVKISIDEIQRIDVARGDGTFIEIVTEESYDKIIKLINENSYRSKSDVEDENGWIIGVRIYYNNMHHWFMPDGVDNYFYNNDEFFTNLLNIILEEIKIDFVEDYLSN